MKYNALVCPRYGNERPKRMSIEIKFDSKFLVHVTRVSLWEYPIEQLWNEIPFTKSLNIKSKSIYSTDGFNKLSYLNKLNFKILDVIAFHDDYEISDNPTIYSIHYVITYGKRIFIADETYVNGVA